MRQDELGGVQGPGGGADADTVARWIVSERVAPNSAAGVRARRGEHDGWVSESGGETDLLFDLASVTKPMTAVAISLAGIDPETPLGALVPEARGTASEAISLELLLAHRAGLEAHRPLFAPLLRGETVDRAAAIREAASARRPDLQAAPPPGPNGFAPLYSDLGYILAGEALARAVGARAAGEAIDRLVLVPMGLAPQAGTVRDLAARDVDGRFAPTEVVPWRVRGGGAILGAVHDENAWALTGHGGSGHAGIFATIEAVLAFGAAVLDRFDALAWLVRPRPGGTLRAGFDGKSPEGSSAGALMGERTVGHLGFTGTSLWIDPDKMVVTALLTNRVCPSRDNAAIRAARPPAHDALFARAMKLKGNRS
ncbi:MAG: beta-lactamase family protein [Myxococcales bacterium]|nr:beta-lactamase family protein [Myxococcales bacterium]